MTEKNIQKSKCTKLKYVVSNHQRHVSGNHAVIMHGGIVNCSMLCWYYHDVLTLIAEEYIYTVFSLEKWTGMHVG